MEINTERLILRELKSTDVEDLVRNLNDLEVSYINLDYLKQKEKQSKRRQEKDMLRIKEKRN